MASRALVKNWHKRFPEDVLKLAKRIVSRAKDEPMRDVMALCSFEVHDTAKDIWQALRPDEFATEYRKGGPICLTWAQYNKRREREKRTASQPEPAQA